MMTSRELVIRALSHQAVERAPREVLVDRAIESAFPDEVAELAARFPSDVVRLRAKYPDGERSQAAPDDEDQYTDAWGVVWRSKPSANGSREHRELIDSPLSDLRNLARYEPPSEVLDGLKLRRVNRQCEECSRFTLGVPRTGLVERVLALRTVQSARKDMLARTKGVRALLSMVHEYCLRELSIWAESEVDGVLLHDDFSAIPQVLDDRGLWRDMLRPLYRDYCRVIREQDKFVVFRAGGDVAPVLTDLIRGGIDAVESGFPGADIDRLAKRYRGRVTFFYGIDQPEQMVHGSPADVREAVNRVRRAFDFGSGGVVGCCRWLPETTIDHMVAFCEQWMVPLPLHA